MLSRNFVSLIDNNLLNWLIGLKTFYHMKFRKFRNLYQLELVKWLSRVKDIWVHGIEVLAVLQFKLQIIFM